MDQDPARPTIVRHGDRRTQGPRRTAEVALHVATNMLLHTALEVCALEDEMALSAYPSPELRGRLADARTRQRRAADSYNAAALAAHPVPVG